MQRPLLTSIQSRLNPHLGQAGSPYARTVKPVTILPANLPDPGLVFDGKLLTTVSTTMIDN